MPKTDPKTDPRMDPKTEPQTEPQTDQQTDSQTDLQTDPKKTQNGPHNIFTHQQYTQKHTQTANLRIILSEPIKITSLFDKWYFLSHTP